MNEWISWDGGECPVPAECEVEMVMQDGGEAKGPAGTLRWKWIECGSDIISYRIITKPSGNSPLQRQEGGDHYKKQAIQPVEYIMANGIPYMEGNVIKYVSRWRDKGGIQDLKKAIHYLEMLIEHKEKQG